MLSDAVELVAFAAFVTAGWLLSPILGLAVLGALLWVLAQALDGVKVRAPKVKAPKPRLPRPRIPSVQIRRPGASTAASPGPSDS